MIQTPKARFLESTLVKAHQETVDSKQFVEAAQATLAQMVWDLPDVTDQVTAAACYHRILGAKQFIRALASLGEKAAPPEPRPSHNLQHDLK